MSHITTVEIEITDLDALGKAAEAIGLELKIGKKTYQWYGASVGDYPLPKGFTKADLGKCSHALAVKGNPRAYEIGVVERRDGKEGYVLHWDFWNGGYGMEKVVGKDCENLKKWYAAELTVKELRRNGHRVLGTRLNNDGEIEIDAQVGARSGGRRY